MRLRRAWTYLAAAREMVGGQDTETPLAMSHRLGSDKVHTDVAAGL